MQQVYPFFIFLSIIGLLTSLICVYSHIKEKKKDPYYMVSAIIWFLLPILMTIGMLLNSEKLVVSAIFFPIGLSMIVNSIEHFVRYKKCTLIVSAKCISFNTSGKGHYYSPQFSYNYNGESILMYSFSSYRKRKFNKLFVINNTYDIFINPENPKHCVDKRYFPKITIFVLIFGIIFLAFGAFVVIFI
ncbi:MAG: hypothetical protein E7526_07175 [Ruminococcaceae bacterium]|nr:hypothetical protein [Oscillospiraceae bacterium]